MSARKCIFPNSSVLLLVLLTISYPATTLVGAAIDNQRKERDTQGYLVWVADADFSSDLRQLLILGMAVLSIHIILSAATRRVARGVVLSSILWVLIILAATLIRGDLREAFAAFLASLILVASMLIDLTKRDLVAPSIAALGALVVAVIFSALNPQRSHIDCRTDKCGVFGSLLTSYMPQENVLALYATVTLALCLFALKRWIRVFSLMLSMLIVMSTGSRAAIAVSIGITFLWLISQAGPNAKKLVGKATSLTTILALVASTAVFLGIVRSDGLTGRDFIFDIVLDGFLEMPLIGPGRGILEEAYNLGRSANFLIAHEHGQAPYLLGSGGLLAFLAFVGFALNIAFSKTVDPPSRIGVGLISASLAAFFITEPSVQADPRSPTFWILAILVALISKQNARVKTSGGK